LNSSRVFVEISMYLTPCLIYSCDDVSHLYNGNNREMTNMHRRTWTSQQHRVFDAMRKSHSPYSENIDGIVPNLDCNKNCTEHQQLNRLAKTIKQCAC